ncbi:MAG: HD domain-containing phosphohydrolase [Candidatus Omnitrophota bacterium]
MVRFSDFNKKKEPQKEMPPTPAPVPAPEITTEAAEARDILPEISLAAIHVERPPTTIAEKIYYNELSLIKTCVMKAVKDEPLDIAEVKELVESILEQISRGNRELVALANSYTRENYLFGHLANTCILSAETGVAQGYPKAKLVSLGICGFLYDIGMSKVMQLANLPRLLSAPELAQIRKHPEYGVEILKRSVGIDETIITVALQHHERADGSGYPNKLKDKQIHEFARIIGVVDVYEAMIHPRLYRKCYMHHQAVKDLLQEGENVFDGSAVKSLIKRIGIYPIGSWVELNTGQIGKVLDVGDTFPLRPTIELAYDLRGKKMRDPKTIELTKTQSLYIKDAVNEADLGIT